MLHAGNENGATGDMRRPVDGLLVQGQDPHARCLWTEGEPKTTNGGAALEVCAAGVCEKVLWVKRAGKDMFSFIISPLVSSITISPRTRNHPPRSS